MPHERQFVSHLLDNNNAVNRDKTANKDPNEASNNNNAHVSTNITRSSNNNSVDSSTASTSDNASATSNNDVNETTSAAQMSKSGQHATSGYTTSVSLDDIEKIDSLTIQPQSKMASIYSPDPDDGIIKLHLKTSIFKKTVSLDRASITLGSLKQMSVDFINELFPGHLIPDLQTQLILRKYDPANETFTPFNAVSDIHHNAYVVVELSERFPTHMMSSQCQKNPHTLKEHTYLKPTDCDHCKKLLMGLYRQGLKCTRCLKNYHHRCANLCGGDGCRPVSPVPPSTPSASTSSHARPIPQLPPPPESRMSQAYQNRPVQRLVKSLRNVRRHDHTETIKEGWLIHRNESHSQGRHFWRLGETDITLYKDPMSKRFFKSILLTQIKRALSSCDAVSSWRQLSPTSRNLDFDSSHTFAFETITGTFYLVITESSDEARDWHEKIVHALRHAKQNDDSQEKQQVDVAAPKPDVTPSENNKEVGDSANLTPHNIDTRRRHVTSPRVSPFRRPYRLSRLRRRPHINIKVPKNDIPEHLVECHYLIAKEGNEKQILGSGQFGCVYAAIGHFKPLGNDEYTGIPVAIKEICKRRFVATQQDQLRMEAEILKQLDHPGVIILEDFYDLESKIYIVMERLKNDMLELIMTSEGSKLSERLTKFLIYQILEALRYLHAKNFAHCDLKPENVLLVSNSETPQIKLCDFGFAKIIDENSFRMSLVGTPAYLAPEVAGHTPYNKALDIWSTGVIVYVSLSGTFPFNNSASIEKQVVEQEELFPKDPWGSISTDARNFINKLLTVEPEKRPSASFARQLQWLNDFQLWCDLIELESQLGLSTVWTDRADYVRWRTYAADNGKAVPKYASDTYGDGGLNC